MNRRARAGLALAVVLQGPPASAQNHAVARIAASAQPRSETEIRSAIDGYLESIDTPITAGQWRALGPGAAPVLEQIAQDRARLPTRRARAVAALGVVTSPRVPPLVMELARREGEAPIVRTSALRTLGELLEGAGLVEAVRPVLERARSSRLRAAAAEVLVRRSPRLGCGPVRSQLAREREARPAFDRALALCDLSAPPGSGAARSSGSR